VRQISQCWYGGGVPHFITRLIKFVHVHTYLGSGAPDRIWTWMVSVPPPKTFDAASYRRKKEREGGGGGEEEGGGEVNRYL
jgi:hypothetical protein